MNKKFKFLTVLLALVMTLGAFAPFSARAEEEKKEEHETTVLIHKMELKDLKGWPKDPGVESNGIKYDGTKLDLKYFGTDAKELKDVKFIYWKVSKTQYETMKAKSDSYKTVDQVNNYLADNLNKGTPVVTEEQELNGESFTAAKLVLKDGYYWFVEDENTVSRDGRTFSSAAAVPFGLALPYAMEDGRPFGTEEGRELHVYPKNKLADKPTVDKDFEGKANPDKPRSEEEKNKPESHNVGDKISYEIKTKFPSKNIYETAFWTDEMTEGLTFNNDVKVFFDNVEAETGDFKVLEIEKNSFKVELTEAGLSKVKNQDKEVMVTVKYSATLNGKAVVEVPESNDVVFHYGNNPSKGNTPKPNKPNEGKITFTKTWEGEAPKGVSITVQLYNANTGEKVEEPKTLNEGNNWKVEWTGLDNDIEYKAVETDVKGYEAEYTKGEGLGVLGVKNWKTNNPPPINPKEPKVETNGKKFVKTDGKGNALEGAEFYVKNSKDEFLKKKANSDIEDAKKKLAEVKANYEKAIKEKNVTEADRLYTEYEKALREVGNEYEWTTNESEALILTSNIKGQFVIAGLSIGKYKLVEKTAPKGFARLEEPQNFDITAESWSKEGNIDFKTAEKGTSAKEIVNKKVTIPQTGGIGTVIFTVVGVMLMVGAAFALKRRKEDELEGLA